MAHWSLKRADKSHLTNRALLTGRRPMAEKDGANEDAPDPDHAITAIDVDGQTEFSRQIEALLRPACNFIQRSRKGHHYVFKYDERLNNIANPTLAVDIRNDGGVLLCQPTQYRAGTKPVKYEWIRTPDEDEDLVPIPDEAMDLLLENGYGIAPPPPENGLELIPPVADEDEPLVVVAPRRGPVPFEEVEMYCGCLSAEWLRNFANWSRLGLCLKGLEDSPRMVALFQRLSQHATPYDYPNDAETVAKRWAKMKPNGRIRINSIKYWARTMDKNAYFKMAKSRYWSLVESRNKNSLCELFVNEMEGEILYSVALKQYFLYDDTQTIWRQCESVALINRTFLEVVSVAVQKLIAEIPRDTDPEKRTALLKNATGFLKYADSNTATCVASFLPAYCCGTEDPADFMNKSPDLFPCENGVWCFSEKRLVPYERDQYFTFKSDIPYEEDADTKLIESAMSDWFNGQTEIIRFVRYWIGYNLTGHTTRQQFLCVWGSSASNAKSLLFAEICEALLGKFWCSLTSSAFYVTGGATPDLAGINGTRMNVMSEPSEVPKMIKYDDNLLKKVTGDRVLKARFLHGNPIEFVVTSKINFICNYLPPFNFADQGMARRALLLEMKVRFLNAKDYASAPEEMKRKGLVKLKDPVFARKLMENRAGLLKYFIAGASDFIDNPLLEPPEAMDAVKTKAANELDALGNWVRGNLRKLEKIPANAKKSVSFKEIRGVWDDAKLDFKKDLGHRFNPRFIECLEHNGFDVDVGRAGKSEQKVLYCELVPDEEEEAPSNTVVLEPEQPSPNLFGGWD
jgi:hypothetical protein